MIGCLIIKNYRIFTIFRNTKSLKTKPIPILNLIAAVGSIVLVDVIILVVMVSGYPLLPTNGNTDPLTPANDFYYCYNAEEDVFTLVFLIYKAIKLAFGIWLSFKLRNVNTNYNETKYIGLATYNLAFCLFVLIVFWRLNGGILLGYVLKYITIMWGVGVTLFVMFIPKFYFIRRNITKTKIVKRGTTSHGSQVVKTTKLESENKRLREEIANLKEQVNRMNESKNNI